MRRSCQYCVAGATGLCICVVCGLAGGAVNNKVIHFSTVGSCDGRGNHNNTIFTDRKLNLIYVAYFCTHIYDSFPIFFNNDGRRRVNYGH